MKLIKSMEFLNVKEMKQIHEGSLKLLSETGMMIAEARFRNALREKGADVDNHREIVKFPVQLIEETLERARYENKANGRLPFSWHNNFALEDRPCMVTASFGGACLYFYDFEKDRIRQSTANDMLKMIQLGEAIPEIASVGNPLM